MVNPLAMAAGFGLSAASYFQQKKIAEATRKWQNAMFAANMRNIRSGVRIESRRVHMQQYESALSRSVQQRENMRVGLQQLGLTQTSSAARGVGGFTAKMSQRDVARRMAENSHALSIQARLEQEQAAVSLDSIFLNAQNQALQAMPTPVQDPSIMNAVMGGLSFGATLSSF